MWIWLTTLIAILAMVLVGLALNFTNTNLSRRSTVPREIDKDAVSYRRSYIWILLLLVVFLIGLSLYHWPQLQYQIWTMPIIILSFVWMVLTIIVAHCNKTYRESPRNLHTTLVLPVYNEAPETLVAVLDSITRQTHRPNVVFMVDDGSTNFAACRAVFEKWRRQAKRRGIVCHYRHTASNNAKREAQAIAFRKYIDKTDIFITIDSDTVLDPNAIREGLKPFSDKRVMAVAGLLLNLNRRNLLVRVASLGFVSSFTNGRASWSALKSVTVNCGGLAFYRNLVIREHFDDYLSQRIFGKLARFGDDRMLTQYATLHGQTVYQESSVAYTLMPEKLGHLTRQRIRWWKSFWWGGLWVIRHQSLRSGAWWLVLSQYITFLLYSALFPAVIIIYPIINQSWPWAVIVYMMILSYARTARTLMIRRPDIRWRQQFTEYLLLSPLSTLLYIYLATLLQYWALLTIRLNGWGTRAKIEVAVKEP